METRDEQLKKIATSIASLRQKAGMTQAEFAEKLDYSTKAVSKWECAESIPDVFVLKKIADLFGVTVDSLFEPETVAEQVNNTSDDDRVTPPTHVKGSTKLWFLNIPMSPKHLCITVLSVLCVWFVAVVAYVVSKLLGGSEPAFWLYYIAAIPVSSIVLLVMNSIWGRRVHNQVIIWVLIWTLILFVYLLILAVWAVNAWLLFLLGVPLSAALPLWNLMERAAEKKRLNKK